MKRIAAKKRYFFLGGFLLALLVLFLGKYLSLPKQEFAYSHIQIEHIERNPDGSGLIKFKLTERTDRQVDRQLPKGLPRVQITCEDLDKVHHVVYPPPSRMKAIKEGQVQEKMPKGEVSLTEILPENTLSLPVTYRFWVSYCGYAMFTVNPDGTVEIN